MDLTQRARHAAIQALIDILYEQHAAGNHEETAKIALLILEVTK